MCLIEAKRRAIISRLAVLRLAGSIRDQALLNRDDALHEGKRTVPRSVGKSVEDEIRHGLCRKGLMVGDELRAANPLKSPTLPSCNIIEKRLAHRHISVGTPKSCHHLLKHVRLEVVVRIQKRKVIPTRNVKSGIARSPAAFSLLRQNENRRMTLRTLPQKCPKKHPSSHRQHIKPRCHTRFETTHYPDTAATSSRRCVRE